MAKPKQPKPARSDVCTCECDACPDDCESCDHEGCDAEMENCGPDCPMADRAALPVVTRRVTRDIPPLALRAAIAPGTLDEGKRTVDVIWTTGARVLRGIFDRFWEELDLSPAAVRMQRLESGAAPLLDTHDADCVACVIGVVESARLEPTRGIATVRFSRDAQGDAVLAKVKDGVLRNVSVGYRIYKLEKMSEGTDEIPVMRASDWEPYEISIVPIGADAGAVVRSAGAETNPCEFIAEEKRQMSKSKNDPQVTEPVVNETSANDETRAAPAIGERTRILEIQRDAVPLHTPRDIVDQHIADGTSADKFRKIAVELFAKNDPINIRGASDAATITAGASEREKRQRGAGDWILERAAVADLIIEHAKKRGEPSKIDGGEFRGMRLLDLARDFLESAGVRTRGLSPTKIAELALSQRAAVGLGANSTGDFPVLLENVLHKVLLAAYGTTPDTWTKFCVTGSVVDFRPHKRLRMGSFGGLDVVNEGGEYANQSIPDATAQSITAQTKGRIISITRQALINDDLSAFNRLATMLGRSARLSIELDVYALLALNAGLGPTMADGHPLFDAAHANVGVGSAIGSAALDADRVVLASQKDPSGNEILDLRPDVLLLPVGLGGIARIINNGQYDYDSTSKFQVPNRVVGLFQTIVDSPRITGTRRYLFASPQIAPVIEVAFLDGQQQPFMQMMDGFRIDAREWKIRLDYAVGVVDFRGCETNAGV